MYLCMLIYLSPYLILCVDVCSPVDELGHHLRATIVSSYYQGSHPILSGHTATLHPYINLYIHTYIPMVSSIWYWRSVTIRIIGTHRNLPS